MTSVCLRLTPGEGTQLNGLNWLMRAVRLLAKHDGTPSPNSQNSSFSTISIFCQSGLTPAQPLRCHDSRIYWGIFFFLLSALFSPHSVPPLLVNHVLSEKSPKPSLLPCQPSDLPCSGVPARVLSHGRFCQCFWQWARAAANDIAAPYLNYVSRFFVLHDGPMMDKAVRCTCRES